MNYKKYGVRYRFRLGINRGLIQRGGAFAIGVTLHSGVENCNRFEPPPPFRFRMGVVVAVVVSAVIASARFITLNSIRSFAVDAIPAAIADVVAVDGAAFAPPEFVLIAIFICLTTVNPIQYCYCRQTDQDSE